MRLPWCLWRVGGTERSFPRSFGGPREAQLLFWNCCLHYLRLKALPQAHLPPPEANYTPDIPGLRTGAAHNALGAGAAFYCGAGVGYQPRADPADLGLSRNCVSFPAFVLLYVTNDIS